MPIWVVCFIWYLQAANFALSKEAVFDGRKSGPRGTYGQMHLDCMSIKNFTKKSHKSTNKLA